MVTLHLIIIIFTQIMEHSNFKKQYSIILLIFKITQLVGSIIHNFEFRGDGPIK